MTPAGHPARARKKVLIADGDANGATIYRGAFQAHGCEVETVTEEDPAFALAERLRPEIMVLDLKLAHGSGLGLLRRVRAHPDLRGITIIVCTSSYVSSALDEAWRAGADLVLTRMDHPPKEVAELALQQAAVSTSAGLAEASTRNETGFDAAPARWKADRSQIHTGSPGASIASHQGTDGAAHGEPSAPGVQRSIEATPAGTREDLAREFLARAPSALRQLRQELGSFALPDGKTVRLGHLFKLHALTHSFACGAAFMGLANVARASGALKLFLADLASDLNRITEARVRLAAHGIDLITRETALAANPGEDDCTACRVLVVCNEEFSRHALAATLVAGKLSPLAVPSRELALELLGESPAGLIVVDYEDLSEQLDSFQLCQRLRETPGHATTPILLVHNGEPTFETQQKAVLSGASDTIGKPFLESEFRLRALCLISGQLARATRQPERVDLEA